MSCVHARTCVGVCVSVCVCLSVCVCVCVCLCVCLCLCLCVCVCAEDQVTPTSDTCCRFEPANLTLCLSPRPSPIRVWIFPENILRNANAAFVLWRDSIEVDFRPDTSLAGEHRHKLWKGLITSSDHWSIRDQQKLNKPTDKRLRLLVQQVFVIFPDKLQYFSPLATADHFFKSNCENSAVLILSSLYLTLIWQNLKKCQFFSLRPRPAYPGRISLWLDWAPHLLCLPRQDLEQHCVKLFLILEKCIS